MNRIQTITFKQDWRCFPKGWTITPKPKTNLLVGDQGCGKSTLLDCLATNKSDVIDIALENDALVETFYLDTEKHNPRMVSSLDLTHLPTHQVLSSRFGSHGESLLPMVTTCNQAEEKIIFVDEPEAGLSIRSQYEILEAFQKAEKQGCQIFIATHSMILIESQLEVFSLEHNQWMDPTNFLTTQKPPKPVKPNAKPKPTGARTGRKTRNT